MEFDSRWKVTLQPDRLKSVTLSEFLINSCKQQQNDPKIKLDDLLVQSIIDQFKLEGEDVSAESALFIYYFVLNGPFSFLYSNLHKILTTSLTRMLYSVNTQVKLIAIESINIFLEAKDFFPDSLVKYQLDELFLQCLSTNYCDKKCDYMLKSYLCIQLIITKCNKKHSERYLKAFDSFCKSYFMSVWLIPTEEDAAEFKNQVLRIGLELATQLDVAIALYLVDFLKVFDICLNKKTSEESFLLLHKIFSFTWPILIHNVNDIIRILLEHATVDDGEDSSWLKDNFIKTIKMLIECCGHDSVEFIYKAMLNSHGDKGAFLSEWFPIA